MVIVGLGLATIAAAVFFSWYYLQRWRTSWRQRRARVSHVQYYQHQRSDRNYPESAEPRRPMRWL
jgi:hypothetical protein